MVSSYQAVNINQNQFCEVILQPLYEQFINILKHGKWAVSFYSNRDRKQWGPCLHVNGSNGETKKKKQILDCFVKKNPPKFMVS